MTNRTVIQSPQKKIPTMLFLVCMVMICKRALLYARIVLDLGHSLQHTDTIIGTGNLKVVCLSPAEWQIQLNGTDKRIFIAAGSRLLPPIKWLQEAERQNSRTAAVTSNVISSSDGSCDGVT